MKRATVGLLVLCCLGAWSCGGDDGSTSSTPGSGGADASSDVSTDGANAGSGGVDAGTGGTDAGTGGTDAGTGGTDAGGGVGGAGGSAGSAIDAAPPADAEVVTLPSTQFQTAGGGRAASAGYTLEIRLGAPQPMGAASSANYNVRLGPTTK